MILLLLRVGAILWACRAPRLVALSLPSGISILAYRGQPVETSQLAKRRGLAESFNLSAEASRPSSWSNSEAARASHFQPAAMRRVDHPQEDGRTIAAPQHDSHRGCIVVQRTHRSEQAACVALNIGGRHVSGEDFAKSACGGIAIQNEVQIVLCHRLYPPVGPNRSVLIVRALCPSST